MKSLFIIPLVLMSLVSSPSWALSMDDLVERDGIPGLEGYGLYYEKFTSTPFTGEVDEGLARGSIKNGKKEGYWETYWENGQLFIKGSFKNGKKEGSWELYWDNGRLFKKGNYKNDFKEGYWEDYNRDGTVFESNTGTYKNGKKVSD